MSLSLLTKPEEERESVCVCVCCARERERKECVFKSQETVRLFRREIISMPERGRAVVRVKECV